METVCENCNVLGFSELKQNSDLRPNIINFLFHRHHIRWNSDASNNFIVILKKGNNSIFYSISSQNIKKNSLFPFANFVITFMFKFCLLDLQLKFWAKDTKDHLCLALPPDTVWSRSGRPWTPSSVSRWCTGGGQKFSWEYCCQTPAGEKI